MIALSPARRPPVSPTSGWWWACLLTTVLFGFHVNHLRLHLLTEHHADGSATGDYAVVQHEDPHGHDHDHDHDHDQPHSESEHLLVLLGKSQNSSSSMVFLLPDNPLYLTLPEPQLVRVPGKFGRRPVEPPPDPAQPRAPPIG